MTDKFTPGPWANRNGRIYQADRDVLTIANVGRAFDGDYSPANATLIAAAPELLQAAVAALELLKVIHDETGKVGMQLQAAIAKARGL